MKYLIMIGDGMSDYPLPELNNKTPLEVANKPNIDKLTKKGRSGLGKNAPDHLPIGSDVANMSIFGYNPDEYYTGRGPLEAVSQGIKTEQNDVVFRCNLITEENNTITDFTSQHITTEEAGEILKTLNQHFQEKYQNFPGTWYTGLSYRHLFVYKNNPETAKLPTEPPHDIVDEDYTQYINWENETGEQIKNIILETKTVLKDHPVNKKRIKNGKKPATMTWLWGQGTKPSLPDFQQTYGINAAVITAVDLLKGLAIVANMDKIDVPGATGFFDTDYQAKADYAAKALENHDLVIVHVEAPDEAGHAAEIEEKIKAIERIDNIILEKLIKELEKYGDYKIAVLPDHPTPVPLKTHSRDPIPFTVYSSKDENKADKVETFSEKTNAEGALGTNNQGWHLIENMLNNKW